MGNTNCTHLEPVIIKKKFSPQDYNVDIIKSANNSYFNKIEKELNYFNQFNLENFLLKLNLHQNEVYKETDISNNLTEGYYTHLQSVLKEKNKNYLKYNSLIYPFNELMMNAFIEKKILRNCLLDQNKLEYNCINYFKLFYYYFSDSCTTSFKSFCKLVVKKKLHLLHNQDCYPKYYLAGLGFFLCASSYKNKLQLFFNIVSDKEKVYSNDYKLKLFIFILVSIPSSLFVCTLEKYAQNDENIRMQFTVDDGQRLYLAYQSKDIIRATYKIINEMFGTNDSENDVKCLDFKQFELIFTSKALFWLFNCSGVRAYLEINNTED